MASVKSIRETLISEAKSLRDLVSLADHNHELARESGSPRGKLAEKLAVLEDALDELEIAIETLRPLSYDEVSE